MMIDYLNLNGLVDGLIMAGTACPFSSECELATSFCPNGSNKSVDFSCAAARAFSLMSLRENHTKKTLNEVTD